jgi:5-methylcytosine-specific restriction endonuclease McrBC regulatory subunit McrC
MNQLFEEFIAEFIRRELREVWQSRGWTFHAQSGTRHLLCDETDRPGPSAKTGRQKPPTW